MIKMIIQLDIHSYWIMTDIIYWILEKYIMGNVIIAEEDFCWIGGMGNIQFHYWIIIFKYICNNIVNLR